MMRIYFKERKEYINLLPYDYLRGYIRRLRREFWAAIGGITVSICLIFWYIGSLKSGEFIIKRDKYGFYSLVILFILG